MAKQILVRTFSTKIRTASSLIQNKLRYGGVGLFPAFVEGHVCLSLGCV